MPDAQHRQRDVRRARRERRAAAEMMAIIQAAPPLVGPDGKVSGPMATFFRQLVERSGDA